MLSGQDLYLFIDESGNFDFSEKGTNHLVMSVFFTSKPEVSSYRLARLKYLMLAQGINIANFHASFDLQAIRNSVFKELANLRNVGAHSFWLSKSDQRLDSHEASLIYGLLGEAISAQLIGSIMVANISTVILVFDKALHAKDERAVRAKLKPLLVKTKIPFHIYFHNVSKDFNGQVADYVAWAQYVALERQEFRPLQALPTNLVGSSNLLDVTGGLRRVTPSR
jgi:hypothetical protein